MKPITLFILIIGFVVQGAVAQTVNVVNMIPVTLSNETNQDSEPDITFNPNNPDEIVASAFTPNPTGSLLTAPIYISQDRGATWVLNNIVPSSNGSTGDITVALSRNNILYAGILFGGGGLDMRILRSSTYTGAAAMTQLLSRTSEDQPYARAYTPMGGAQRDNDHLYVGHNDFNNSPQTASFEQSLDVATAAAPAGLTTIRLERRVPSGQDGPPIRQAIHPDGTVYAVYTQRTASVGSVRTGNIVVVRDDDWGQGVTPYSDITDPGDGLAGVFVVSGVSWTWNSGSVFGQERLGDRASIAVDPTNSQTVYVAWADLNGGSGNTATLHVRNSIDGGNTWSADLRTIAGAISPQLAVNIRGDVGFLYQQLTGAGASQAWETHFQQSTDGGATWTDFTLADVPSNTPAATFLPYIGDYAGLTAEGKDFYGVFSANNTPDNANFPNGVTYQRNANFGTNTLTDGAGAAVSVSIDPFFVHVENLAEDRDFYVRDWTDSPTVNDSGIEPSTDPIFYTTSDVWNRRSNISGGFTASDQPNSEDPQISTDGTNFGFARVHRKDTGSSETVTLHFLKSEFGTGSNYQAAGVAPDPTLSFLSTDQVLTMSSGYPWDLLAVASTHTCLAVEISTPNDPIVPPGLLGRAPGWPTTDLMVIYDNNKAQRNMGVYSGAGITGTITYWAVVHNPATFYRDFILDIEIDPRFRRLFGEARIAVVGKGEVERGENRLVLINMEPGENRWVSLTVPVTPNQEEGEQVGVNFYEMVGEQAVNGHTIAVQRTSIEQAGVESLRLLAANLHRLGYLLEIPEATERSKELLSRLREKEIDPREYAALTGEVFGPYVEWLKRALEQEPNDPFALSESLNELAEVIESGNPERIFPHQSNLDHAVDAFLTYLDKKRGDVADVAQNMRWQSDLLSSVERVGRIEGVSELIRRSEQFDRGYASGRFSVEDYATAVERSLPVLVRINESLDLNADEALAQIQESLADPQALQRAHREFLLRLETLRSSN